MTKGEQLSHYLKSMKQNQLINHRECWACIDHIVRFHFEKMSDDDFDKIFSDDD